MTEVARIQRQFGITKLQWSRALKKAQRRTGKAHPHPGLVLMIFLVDLRDLTVDEAFAEIERVTGERPMHARKYSHQWDRPHGSDDPARQVVRPAPLNQERPTMAATTTETRHCPSRNIAREITIRTITGPTPKCSRVTARSPSVRGGSSAPSVVRPCNEEISDFRVSSNISCLSIGIE